MGGIVPLGYRVESRALHIVEEHAALVRTIFRRYLELGAVVPLKAVVFPKYVCCCEDVGGGNLLQQTLEFGVG